MPERNNVGSETPPPKGSCEGYVQIVEDELSGKGFMVEPESSLTFLDVDGDRSKGSKKAKEIKARKQKKENRGERESCED